MVKKEKKVGKSEVQKFENVEDKRSFLFFWQKVLF